MNENTAATDLAKSASDDTVRIRQGERTATDVMRALEDGRRVVIDIDRFDGSMQASVRKKGDTYYCDTVTKLLIRSLVIIFVTGPHISTL